MTTADLLGKLEQVVIALAAFAAVIGLLLFLIDRAPKKRKDFFQLVGFVTPAFVLLIIGLVYPAIRTAIQSLYDARGNFIGLDNFAWVFTQPDSLVSLRNTI